MTRSRTAVFFVALLALSIASPSRADWWEVVTADAALDLAAARQQALNTVERSPQSLQAVAAAGWWYENLNNLVDPEAMLRVGNTSSNPELFFFLGKIAAELHRKPPPGSLPERLLSGPWGVFGRLDIDRNVVPDDAGLPPIGTRWQGAGTHFNSVLRSADGFADVPAALRLGGVYLAVWPLELSAPFDGFLVVETTGDLNLEVDGEMVARRRFPGIQEPGVSWYRVTLEAGAHRIRATTLPLDGDGVRLTFFSTEGQAAELAIEPTQVPTAPLSPSTVTALPHEPAAAPPDWPPARTLLLRAELARLRNDPRRQKDLIDEALTVVPDDPMVHLAAAAYYLVEPTDNAPEVDYRRAREHLSHCTKLPVALLLEHLLARRQERYEDAERLTDQLVDLRSSDPRVLRMRITQAVNRGWAREAEEALAEFESTVGAVTAVDSLRLGVLEAIERWQERRVILRRLAEDEILRSEWISLLADECCVDLAVDLVSRLREQVVDPDLDADFVRLLSQAERQEDALRELRLAIDRWGNLADFDALLPLLLRENGEPWKRALRDILERQPDNIAIRSLAWRHGVIEPFWQPFAVDARSFASAADTSEEGVDAILLLDQAVERVFDDGSSLYYYHGLSKALTPAGASQVSTLEQMPRGHRITLRIIKPDGSVIVPAEIGGNGVEVVLGEVEAGDLVEEEYVAAVASIAPGVRGHLSPYVYRFADSDRNFGLSEYILVMPAGIDLKVDGFFDGVESSEETRDGTRLMKWRARDVAAVPDEPFAPPSQELLPWVTYGFGVGWNDVGDSLRDRLVSALRSSRDLNRFAAEYLDQDDPVAALRSLVGALNDRVADGPDFLDLGSTAGASFSRERGNRLGVLAGALVAAGWDVDMVLTRPAPYAGTHLAVPSTDVFVAPVLRVRRGGRTIWIDPRQERAGVDSLSPVIQGSDGLVLPLGDPLAPVTIESPLPSFPNPELEDRTRLEASVTDTGKAHIRYSTTLTDVQAVRFGETLQSVPKDKVGQVFDRLAVGMFPGAQGVTGTVREIENAGLEVTLDLVMEHACTVAPDTMTCRALVMNQPLTPILASLPARQFPLVLQLPVLRHQETIIQPPPGWTIDGAERKLSSRWGTVEEHIERSSGDFRATVSLTVHATRVPPEEYAAFARFCRAVDELLGRPPVLTRVN